MIKVAECRAILLAKRSWVTFFSKPGGFEAAATCGRGQPLTNDAGCRPSHDIASQPPSSKPSTRFLICHVCTSPYPRWRGKSHQSRVLLSRRRRYLRSTKNETLEKLR